MSEQLDHIATVATECSLDTKQVEAVGELLAGGATVPFIARYRKEATGSLDEVVIATIRDRLTALDELDKRRQAILKSLEERWLLTDELKSAVAGASSMTVLEDVYLPYRPKRRTRATIAKEKGLEPLADLLWNQDAKTDAHQVAANYVDKEKDVSTPDEALAGARDIVAERISELPRVRRSARDLLTKRGVLISKAKSSDADQKFRDYFEWSESAVKAPSHRVLAMFRGEAESSLNVRIRVPDDEDHSLVQRLTVTGSNSASRQVNEAAVDCSKRLLGPSLETEFRNELKKRADEEAIDVFADNLRHLLLESPLGPCRVLALDPGFRTGCKTVCLDEMGSLLHETVIYPHLGKAQEDKAGEDVARMCRRYEISAVAIGNGTAGKETEAFVRGLDLPGSPKIISVDESGASIYSASEIARKEFPESDVTTRGAVSIGRRLMDPLAELIKIDPKSIGVGQYQHDVDQTALKSRLDDVVVSCVAAVGVEVNTASEALLTYVPGLGPVLAANIVAHRSDSAPFSSRRDLKSVARLGNKAFEQAAGFLRIRNSKHPLDASAVHPERYATVKSMSKGIGCSVGELMGSEENRKRIDPAKYVTADLGLPTLTDILAELEKPGRDPRETFEVFEFASGVDAISDLTTGMILNGLVTNVTNFGAFVDVGVHQDGLVHISQLADKFVKHPSDVVQVRQQVKVKVMDVDLDRGRISLSMKDV